jgi:hypothetical protein
MTLMRCPSSSAGFLAPTVTHAGRPTPRTRVPRPRTPSRARKGGVARLRVLHDIDHYILQVYRSSTARPCRCSCPCKTRSTKTAVRIDGSQVASHEIERKSDITPCDCTRTGAGGPAGSAQRGGPALELGYRVDRLGCGEPGHNRAVPVTGRATTGSGEVLGGPRCQGGERC